MFIIKFIFNNQAVINTENWHIQLIRPFSQIELMTETALCNPTATVTVENQIL